MRSAGQAVTVNGVRFAPREWSIALRVAEGMLYKQIAGDLGLSEGTVKVYLHNITKNMNAAHPELRNRSTHIILAEWVRCYECREFRDHGCGI